MKAQNDLSLWSIIERMQRRLERQGMPPATADRALSLALRQLATSPASDQRPPASPEPRSSAAGRAPAAPRIGYDVGS